VKLHNADNENYIDLSKHVFKKLNFCCLWSSCLNEYDNNNNKVYLIKHHY